MERGGFFLKASRENLRVVLAVLREWERENSVSLSRDAVFTGLAAARWPGRFDVRRVAGREVLFDAAHNLAGMEFFGRMLSESPYAGQRFHVVYASLSDKDWRSILPRVATLARTLTLTQVTSERAVPAASLASKVEFAGSLRVEADLERALSAVLSGEEGPILVLGSIALIGECMELWGIEPFPSD